MQRFRSELVHGREAPYDTWTFVVVPDAVVAGWGAKRADVRGTVDGAAVRGTVSKGEGCYRMLVRKALLEELGKRAGDAVRVALELDPEPRPVVVPDELRAVLDADRGLRALFDALPPGHRRAWASHVGEAKRPETRERRAQRARDGIRGRRFPNE